MKIKGGALRQVILFVQDMESEVRFYRDVMDFEVIYPNEVDDYAKEIWVELAAGDCILALHGGAQEPAGGQHELIFAVEDIHDAREILIQSGIKMGEVRLLEDGQPSTSGWDPAGHRFSIRPASKFDR
jgi:catechol 2,3-dioxygenase-like lactoylglutathione lyase family enzyme